MNISDVSEVVHSQGSGQPLLSIQNLTISFDTMKGKVKAIRNVNLNLYQGEILGIIGETGSGKSITCKAITRLLPKETIMQGKILFRNKNLVTLPLKELQEYRGKAISMIFQDPMSNLDQIRSIYSHMREVTSGATKQEKREIDAEKLSSLHIQHALQRIDDYPFQFSGGMAQRVQIAMSLLGDPEILIADEPTSALDVTIQNTILKEFKNLSHTMHLSIILITHDFGVVSEICDRVAVMYHGTIVESGMVSDIIAQPFHPYTHALLQSVPSLESFKYVLTPIQGDCLANEEEVQGCDFAPRCPFADTRCKTEKPGAQMVQNRYIHCFHPILSSQENLEKVMRKHVLQHSCGMPALDVYNLGCVFDTKNELGDIVPFHAVDNVSFQLHAGEIFGIVGESGSGKSTIAKAIMGINRINEGSIRCMGIVNESEEWSMKNHSKRVQYVFQDPLGALDPHLTIIEQVAEPLCIHKHMKRKERNAKATEILRICGLEESHFYRKPGKLSGGQRQRAVLARALINEPEILICDEPVSAMDVSVQAQIINLLEQLARERNMSMIFISHDLRVINNICDRIAVMYAGRFVEMGGVEQIFQNPIHPYTKMLLGSIPNLKEHHTFITELTKGENHTASEGCPFCSRCKKATELCHSLAPVLKGEKNGHFVSCFNLD